MVQRSCAVDGCERSRVARGWCDAHYRRWKKCGDPGEANLDEIPEKTKPCAVEGCTELRVCRTYCKTHYARLLRTGDPTVKSLVQPVRMNVCDFVACDRPCRTAGLCAAHYLQKFHGRELVPLLVRPDTTARDEQGRKSCSACLEWRPTGEFYSNAKTKDGLGTYCRGCQKSDALQRNYGISLDDYEAMLSAQGGVCAICQGANKDGRQLFVDHDHETGAVRGLLCNLCNRGIGNMRDSVELLRSAINYLSRSAAVRE